MILSLQHEVAAWGARAWSNEPGLLRWSSGGPPPPGVLAPMLYTARAPAAPMCPTQGSLRPDEPVPAQRQHRPRVTWRDANEVP